MDAASKRLKSWLPTPVKAAARPMAWWSADKLDQLAGRLAPPRSLRPAEFEAVGREFLGHFVELGGLRPDHRVLDIGCGFGRMAIPLTGYLGPPGSYVGIDHTQRAVEWCQREIHPRFPIFEFVYVDGLDTRDEPNPTRGRQAVIPRDDASFDFATVCAVSELDQAGLRRRLCEAGRLLRPDGAYLGTWFLLADGDDRFGYHPLACTESELHSHLGAAGLSVQSVYYGWWNDRGTMSYQDLVVARRDD